MKNWAMIVAPRNVPAFAMSEATTMRQPSLRKVGMSRVP